MWPKLLDIPRDQCFGLARNLECQAYTVVIDAFRAGGVLTEEKKSILESIRKILNISEERHKAEVRRAVNDELLATVNKRLCGSDTSHSWEREGRRIVPVLPRAVARTGLTPTAQSAAETLAKQNSALLRPCDTRTPAPLPPLPAPEHLLTTRHQPAPVVTVPHPDLAHQHSSYNGVSDKRCEAGSDETGVVVLPSGTVVRVSAPPVSSRGQNKRGAGKRRRSSTARSKNIEVFSGGLAQLAAAAEAHADLSPPRKIPSILGAGHGYARPLPSSSPLPDRQVVLPPDSAGGGRRGPGRPPGPASPGVMQVVQGRGRPRLVSGGARGRGGRPRGGVLITPRLSSPQSVSSSPVSAAAALLVPHSSTGHVLHGSPIVTTARLALRPTTVTVASPRATTIQLKQEQTSLTNPALQGLKVISHSNTKIVPKSATAVYVVPNSSGGTQRILTNASTALPGVIKTVRTGAGGKPSVIVLQKGAGLPTVSGGVAVYRPVQTTDSSGAVQAVYRPARARVVSGSQVSGAAGNNLFVLNMTKQQQTTAATTTSQEKLEESTDSADGSTTATSSETSINTSQDDNNTTECNGNNGDHNDSLHDTAEDKDNEINSRAAEEEETDEKVVKSTESLAEAEEQEVIPTYDLSSGDNITNVVLDSDVVENHKSDGTTSSNGLSSQE